jgi:predicted NBD/HSP70 family sugar kinase
MAVDIMDHAVAALGTGIASAINLLDIDTVIVGGDSVVHDVDGHDVPLVQGVRPDAAGETGPALALHETEETGLLPPSGTSPGRQLHGRPAGVRLDAAAPAAGAGRAVLHHHHVPDLTRGTPALPLPVVEDDAAADSGAPGDPQE